jgi:hypothetical protein
MLGLGSRIRPADQADASAGSRVPRCPTCQQQVRQQKVRAHWAFVSPVSPNLQIMDNVQNRDMGRQEEELFVVHPPELRLVGQCQWRRGFVVQGGWDTREVAETHASVTVGRPLRHCFQILRVKHGRDTSTAGKDTKITRRCSPGAASTNLHMRRGQGRDVDLLRPRATTQR